MKALVKTKKGDGNLEIRERKIPDIPEKNWVLIKVMAAGVCGTDLHIWHDQFPYWAPVTIGHEFSGEVVETGASVNRIRKGDRVVAEPHSLACGECYLCREGKIQLCGAKRSPGWGIDGAFTQYVVMPEKLLHKIPDGMQWDVAALAEPMAIAVHQVSERCGIGCQDFVVVSGAGTIGILAAFVAKSMGAGTVLATGTERRQRGGGTVCKNAQEMRKAMCDRNARQRNDRSPVERSRIKITGCGFLYELQLFLVG